MSIFTDLPAKSNAVWEKMVSFLLNIPKFIKNLSNPEQAKSPKGILLAALAVVAVVLVICLGVVLMEEKERSVSRGTVLSGPPLIPTEELFLPDEPDFLPKILLDREKKEAWTDADASAHWRDPKELGDELWKKEVETVIDTLLEVVP
ncbi:hypothetical protein ACYULU_04555 [Breznakiellaceae bacterium SP9]